MELVKRKRDSILARCENCGREIGVPFSNLTRVDSRSFELKAAVMCGCGEYHNLIIATEENSASSTPMSIPKDDVAKCPKCGSSQLHAGDKGFSLGKAAFGNALIGPVGLLGGLLGSKKIMVTCLQCGHKWEAGRR